MKIIFRRNVDKMPPLTMRDFISTHESFTSPEYVLQDHISLFFISGENAVFAECPPGVEAWRSNYGAFITGEYVTFMTNRLKTV